MGFISRNQLFAHTRVTHGYANSGVQRGRRYPAQSLRGTRAGRWRGGRSQMPSRVPFDVSSFVEALGRAIDNRLQQVVSHQGQAQVSNSSGVGVSDLLASSGAIGNRQNQQSTSSGGDGVPESPSLDGVPLDVGKIKTELPNEPEVVNLVSDDEEVDDGREAEAGPSRVRAETIDFLAEDAVLTQPDPKRRGI